MIKFVIRSRRGTNEIQHCQLIQDDLDNPGSYASTSTMTTISVQAFNETLAHLLLGTSEKVVNPTRFAILDLLARIRRADAQESGNLTTPSPTSKRSQGNIAFLSNNLVEDDDHDTPLYVGLFKKDERTMFRQELLYTLVIGLSRMDIDDFEPEEMVPADTSLQVTLSTNGHPDNPYFPPTPKSTSPASSKSSSPTDSTSGRKSSPHSTSRSPPASKGSRSPPPSPGSEWPEELPQPHVMDHDHHHQDYEEAYEYLGSDAHRAPLGRLASMSLMAAVTATGEFMTCF